MSSPSDRFARAPFTSNASTYRTCSGSSLNDQPDQDAGTKLAHTSAVPWIECPRPNRPLVGVPAVHGTRPRECPETNSSSTVGPPPRRRSRTIRSRASRHPPPARIHACTDAGVWRSGFVPIRFTSSLSCNTVLVNCGFDDRASATNRHRTVLSTARRRTSLARWLERDCSNHPTNLTYSATNARHVHPTRCTSWTEPLFSPDSADLAEPSRAPTTGRPAM